MRKLITYFIKYPITGNLLLILILIFGYFGMNSLRKTFFPESESKIILVEAVYPGASPTEIEEGIVLKMEDNLDGVTGVDRVTSVSRENVGIITVEVGLDYKTELVLNDVKNVIDRINSFPSGMEPPAIYIRENRSLALKFALSGDLSILELKEISRKVENDLKSYDEISRVELSGFPEEEIEIRVKNEDLQRYGLSIESLALAVRNFNLETTGGLIETEKERILIRAYNKSYSGVDLERVVVKELPSGQTIFLGDVANIVETWEDVPYEEFYKGNKAVVVTVNHTIHEDLVTITEIVKEYIEKFNAQNEVVRADIVQDQSITLLERIALLTNNGAIGFFLVLIILSLFLHPYTSFWVALSIPISFAGMFILSAFYGISINVISLFGMIIVIGILVDDGIVIAENIYQHLERGKRPIEAAIDGTLEVLPAITSAILTTIAAFSIFFFLDGRMGSFFPEMGFVVIGTLIFSLVEGIFILPAHIAHSNAVTGKKSTFFLKRIFDEFTAYFRTKIVNPLTRGLDKLSKKIYQPFLKFSIKHPLVIVVGTICMFGITIASINAGVIKLTVFPNIESDFINVVLKMPPGTSLDITEGHITEIQNTVFAVNDSLKETYGGEDLIQGIERTLGPNTNEAKLLLVLLTSEIRIHQSDEIINMIRARTKPVPNAEQLSITTATPFGKPISVALYSSDNQELENARKKLIEDMDALGKFKNIESSDDKGMQELNLKLKPNALSLGISYGEIMREVRNAFFGKEVQRLQKGIDEVKVWIRYDKSNRSSIGDLENMYINLRGNSYVLKDLVSIERTRGVVAINHIDGKRSISVTAELINPKLDNTNVLSSYIRSDILPPIFALNPSVKFSQEGQIRDQKKTAASASKVGPVILILMLAIIVITFRSYLQMVAVLSMIPFGFIGVGWGHFLHGVQISMFSWFGVIALIGIMVNDSLVLITAMNSNLKTGLTFKASLLKAGISRFRPILLTSLTTVAGLTPLMFEKSFQAQFLIPMAIAIAYGLIMATFLTLIFLPSVLQIINNIRWTSAWLGTGENKTPEEIEPAIRELESKESEEISRFESEKL